MDLICILEKQFIGPNCGEGVKSSASQLRRILPTRVHLIVETFLVVTWRYGGCYWHLLDREARTPKKKNLAMHMTASHNKELSSIKRR